MKVTVTESGCLDPGNSFFTTGSSEKLVFCAHRFVNAGAFPWNPSHHARLAETRQIGDVVLLRYALSSRFAEVS